MPPIGPTASGEGGASATPSAGRGGWADFTIRLATSWLGQFTAYLAALTLAVTNVRKFSSGLHDMGLPPWSGIALVVAFPLLALVFSTIPSRIEQRRIKTRSALKVNVEASHEFTLWPRKPNDKFERADQAHVKVLQWIKENDEPVLYLTGASGTGKSSLLTARVIPRLQIDRHLVIQVRGYEEILDRIKAGSLDQLVRSSATDLRRSRRYTSNVSWLRGAAAGCGSA
jgi:hypothetical protein